MSIRTPIRNAGRTALALVIATFAVRATASDTPSPPAAPESPGRPLVLMIHADWCGTCRVLSPIWEQIQSDFAATSTVVTFDVTDRPAYTESVATAKALGIEDFFSRHRAKTGTIAVLACASREPVAVLSGERDFEVYRVALAEAACEAS